MRSSSAGCSLAGKAIHRGHNRSHHEKKLLLLAVLLLHFDKATSFLSPPSARNVLLRNKTERKLLKLRPGKTEWRHNFVTEKEEEGGRKEQEKLPSLPDEQKKHREISQPQRGRRKDRQMFRAIKQQLRPQEKAEQLLILIFGPLSTQDPLQLLPD